MKEVIQLLTVTILTVTCCPLAFANEPVSKPVIQVDTVSATSGINVPAGYLDALNHNILLELGKTHHFNNVITTDDPSNPAAAALEMKGTVTEFKAGSRAARIAVGAYGRMMGIGQTRLVTHITLLEAGSGAVIWEGDVAGAQKGNGLVNPASQFSSSRKVANIEAEKIAKAVVRAVDKRAKDNQR